MTPTITLLVLASAALHALWNAALKRQRDPESAAVAILAVAAVVAAMAAPVFSAPLHPKAVAIGWSLAAGACEAGYFITLALALRAAPLGVAYTVSRGGAIALVWPISVIWLGESVGVLPALGAVTVCLGLVLLGREGKVGAARRGVAWAVACAAFIAGYHLAYKCALSTGAAPASVFAIALGLALPVNLARLGRSGLTRMLGAVRASPISICGAGAVCTASFLLFLAALARGGAGWVISLRNTSVVFALFLGAVLGEKVGPPQIAGTLCVLAGAALLAS